MNILLRTSGYNYRWTPVHGSVVVGAMSVYQVNILKTETLEGCIHAFDNMFAGKTTVINRVVAVSLALVYVRIA